MKNFLKIVIFSLVFNTYECCFGIDDTNITALGAWSEPVTNNFGYALRARLLIAEYKDNRGYTNHINMDIYVELQRMSDSTHGEVQVYCDFTKGLKCQVSDVFGKPPEPVGTGYDGGAPSPRWISLASLAGVRLRANMSAGGRMRDGSFGIWFAGAGDWTIKSNDTNTYFLSGTLTIIPPSNNFDQTQVWSGTLELPKMKLPR